MHPQMAICQPRFKIEHFFNSLPVVHIEDGISQNTVEQLRQLGHNVQVERDMSKIMFGRAQIIQVRQDCMGNRVLWSGSESRADGCAMGY